ncbi:carbohydrate ABC transporter permease [Paenibacillus sp. DMB20]|uniref:carbohydrate ABC transporter permease n=1 Tax=Paenibacillus sp. DMB20 TaxID=1642570 RepID=UPI000627752D|nr:carbohydrate ABC transporter permease [Paenibacillus sp. DMB20]KKO54121.1 sugar ABC transporter permease [Paenibacillus sp. DMB20]
MIDRSLGDRIFNVVNYALLTLVTLVVLYPLLFVVSASVSNPEFVLRGEMWFIPKGFNLDAYAKIFQNKDILLGYGNTILYTLIGTAINVVLTICAAYPLSRRDLTGRGLVTGLIVFTMFFGGGLIPTYLLIKNLNMLDTLWVMVIPNAVSVWNIIIMRTFFQQSIPGELQESAMIDGCTHFQTLLRIVLPLSMPIIAVMVLFYAVGHWNSYFNALIYLTTKERFPLQLILREILIQSDSGEFVKLTSESAVRMKMSVEGLKYAVLVVANLPMLVLYPFLQRYFVKGIMIGALKG